jgi:hypothetical protein
VLNRPRRADPSVGVAWRIRQELAGWPERRQVPQTSDSTSALELKGRQRTCVSRSALAMVMLHDVL